MTNNNCIRIKPLKVKHCSATAKLHITGIPRGFISSLGVGFVTALYEAIAKNKSSFGFVAEENKKILGFVAFTTNLNQLYRSIIPKKAYNNAWRFRNKKRGFCTTER